MYYLKNVEGMKENTYESILEKLCSYIYSRRLDFEHNIKLMEKDDSLIDVKKLKICLETFENCKWLENQKYKNGSFINERKNIISLIKDYINN